MIDIHSHILAGMDDGAATEEQTIAMLELAEQHGTTAIAATPHADTHFRYSAGRVAAAVEKLNASGRFQLQVYTGCDFHLMFENIEDALRHPTRYTLNHKNYLLVELSDLIVFQNTGDLFGRLEQAGITIVLTHPERNPLLRQRLELIEEWVASGRLMQVTAQSLLGQFGSSARSFSVKLLDKGLVHFVASDAHDLEGRPPRLDLAREWLSRHYSAGLAQLLLETNPRRALAGDPVPPSPQGGRVPEEQSAPQPPGFWARLLGRG
jgi:protein-tyrosine phosphatase